MGLHGMRFPGLREKAGGYVSKYASKGRAAAAGRVAITGLVVLFLLSASSVFAASEDSLPSYLVEKWGSLTLSARSTSMAVPNSALSTRKVARLQDTSTKPPLTMRYLVSRSLRYDSVPGLMVVR